MSNPNAVILERLLRIGDTIVSSNSEDTIRYRGVVIPDGITGTVIGFRRYEKAIGRTEVQFGLPTGIYEVNGMACVKWSTGKTSTPSCHDIAFTDNMLKDVRMSDTAYAEAFESALRISDLPDLPVCEGDLLLIKRLGENTAKVTVNRIEYLNYKRFCDDGITPYRFISVRSVDEGWIGSANLKDIIEIQKRGNHYWHEHDKEKLEFKDLDEEASFYRTLGFAEQVKNPASGNYRWTLEALKEAILKEEVDVISTSGSFFGSVAFPVAYRFPTMPELGERLRKQTICGFEWK